MEQIMPFAFFLLGTSASSLPSIPTFRRLGRFGGFAAGCVGYVAAACCGILAVLQNSLALLLIAAFLIGVGQGIAMFYRFAASEVCAEGEAPFAVTLVLFGGVLAAFAGPELATVGEDMLPEQFLGVFAIVGVLALLVLVVLCFVQWPRHQDAHNPEHKQEQHIVMLKKPELHACQLLMQRKVMLPLAICVMSDLMMIIVMGPFVVRMEIEGRSRRIITTTLELHFFSMFAPGFFSGAMMNKFGATPVALLGAILMACSATTMLLGSGTVNYILGMMLCGSGWHFGFVAATVMLEDAYSEHESIRVQGWHDFILYGVGGATALSSGLLPWAAVLWSEFGVALAMGLLMVVVAYRLPQTEAGASSDLGSELIKTDPQISVSYHAVSNELNP